METNKETGKKENEIAHVTLSCERQPVYSNTMLNRVKQKTTLDKEWVGEIADDINPEMIPGNFI